MRILITGVCGFVGSVVARGLRERHPDWELCGVDNFSRPGSELNRLDLARRGVSVRHGDVRSSADLAGLPACEWIVDAAANPSVLAGVDGRTESAQLLEHNLLGTVNVLEQAKRWRSGFILLSTSRVYSVRALASLPRLEAGERFQPDPQCGTPGFSVAGVDESFSCDPPLSLYGAAKRASELLALEYGEAFGLPVRVNRCGVLAGPGQFGRADQGIFSWWIHAWAQQRPLKYIGFGGSGRQVRDCLDARDLVPLLSAQIREPAKAGPRVLNVSGGVANSVSLRELSAWCQSRFGPRPVAVELQERPFDVPWLVLDSRACASLWDWKPFTPVERIFEDIASHAEKNPGWLDITAS